MRIQVLLLILLSNLAWADMGPKPTMTFTFEQAEGLSAVSGSLFQSEKPDGSMARPLDSVGPQGFKVQAKSCSALAYGFAPYNFLEITFSDGKIRRSNVFPTEGMNTTYAVIVRADDLLVESKTSDTDALYPKERLQRVIRF